MDGDAVKGLVYLTLTIGGVAAIAIGILWWKLSEASKQLALERKAKAELQRKLEHLQAKLKAEGMTDDELLDDVADVLRPRG